jgi:hypothetical protein
MSTTQILCKVKAVKNPNPLKRCFSTVEPPNVITLEKAISDHINQMITLTKETLCLTKNGL